MKRASILAFQAALLLLAGCFTLPQGKDLEDLDYVEFLDKGKAEPVAVTAFAHETGLSRDRWGRRKVFLAVSGSLFGIAPYPWDLRIIWSPPAFEKDETFDPKKYDDELAAALAEFVEKEGFKVRIVDANVLAKEGKVSLGQLLDAAKEKGAKRLYVVSYNEFNNLRFRAEIKRHQGYLTNRVKNMKGVALIPTVGMFMVDDGRPILSRADVGRRGQKYNFFFYYGIACFGWASPFDGKSESVVRFIRRVSSKTMEVAREKTAHFLVDRDFLPKPRPEGAAEEEPGEQAAEEPAKETPEDTPIDRFGEKPPEEQPGEETPEEQPGIEPPEEQPGEETPEEQPEDPETPEEEPGE